MELESMTRSLANKHGMSPEEFLKSNIKSVYHTDNYVPITFLREIRIGHLELESNQADAFNQSLGNFVLFAQELNPFLDGNYKLNFIFPYEDVNNTYDGDDSEMYMAITYSDERIIRNSQGRKCRGLEVYNGKMISVDIDSIGDFSCVYSNPKLEDIFWGIKEAHNGIEAILKGRK